MCHVLLSIVSSLHSLTTHNKVRRTSSPPCGRLRDGRGARRRSYGGGERILY